MLNKLFIISGPAGAGKNGIIEAVIAALDAERVVTTSTRPIRPGEAEGRPYYFISKERFQEMIAAGEFVEWALEQNGNYYGGTKKEVERIINGDKIGVWEIEYQGVIAAKKIFKGLKAILINAPLESLERRLRERDVDRATEEYVKERMEYTKKWLKHKDIYDFEVMNYDGRQAEAIEKTLEIIRNELKRT